MVPQRRQGQVLSFPGFGGQGQIGPQDGSVPPYRPMDEIPRPDQPFDIRNQPADMGVPAMPVPQANQPFDIPQPQVPSSDQANSVPDNSNIFNLGQYKAYPDPSLPVPANGIQVPKPPGLDTTLHQYPLPSPPTEGEGFDINSILARYDPEHAGIDIAKKSLENIPKRANYHPSLMRKIFGGIAAGLGGGVPAWEYITEGPYDRNLEDWTRQFNAANTVAQREGQSNALERQLVTSLIQAKTAEDRQRVIDSYNDAMVGIRGRQADTQQMNAETARLRAETAAARQKDPRVQFYENRDGMVFKVSNGQLEPMIDPTTGQIMLSRNLTPNDRAELQLNRMTTQQENAMALERQRQSNAMDRLGQQQINAMDQIRERARLRASTGANGRPMSPSEYKTEIYNRAQEYVRTHPETRDWFTFGQPNTGDFSLGTPEDQNQVSWWKGDQAVAQGLTDARNIYLNIIRGIYGEQEAQEMAANMGITLSPAQRDVNVAPPPPNTQRPNTGGNQGAIPPPNTGNQPNLTGRRLTVLGPDGQPAGTIDASEATQLPPGYTLAPGQ